MKATFEYDEKTGKTKITVTDIPKNSHGVYDPKVYYKFMTEMSRHASMLAKDVECYTK